MGGNEQKDFSAGQISYRGLSGGLDIVSVGKVKGSRNVTLWHNVMVPGSATVPGGNLSVGDVSTDLELYLHCPDDHFGADKVSSYMYVGVLDVGLNGMSARGATLWGGRRP